ncbi:MAG: UMP kinase, partial [Bacteroidales bacterium]|nr:UMP kinase [Bacteroidales bacterium]
MKYKRILLKLSGESLMGDQDYGISPDMLAQYASEIKQAKEEGAEIGVVIGGGNIFRGLQGAAKGMDRVQGDYMGMLATVINSMALQAELEKQGVKTELLGGLAIEPICKESSR